MCLGITAEFNYGADTNNARDLQAISSKKDQPNLSYNPSLFRRSFWNIFPRLDGCDGDRFRVSVRGNADKGVGMIRDSLKGSRHLGSDRSYYHR
jgi:hypothetical protein